MVGVVGAVVGLGAAMGTVVSHTRSVVAHVIKSILILNIDHEGPATKITIRGTVPSVLVAKIRYLVQVQRSLVAWATNVGLAPPDLLRLTTATDEALQPLVRVSYGTASSGTARLLAVSPPAPLHPAPTLNTASRIGSPPREPTQPAVAARSQPRPIVFASIAALGNH